MGIDHHFQSVNLIRGEIGDSIEYSNRRCVLPAEIIGRNHNERRLWRRIETLLVIPVDEIIIFLFLSSNGRILSAFERRIRFHVSSRFRIVIFLYIYILYNGAS